MPMKREVRDAWVKALRSGEHNQGTDALGRVQDGELQECCLGVLCNIMKVPFKVCPVHGDRVYFFPSSFGYDAFSPPKGFQGLDEEQINNLATLNDNDRWSFDEIADWIEKNIEVED